MSGELFATGGVSSKHSAQGCEANVLSVIRVEVEKLWERAVVYLDQSRKHQAAQEEHRGPSSDYPPPLTPADLERFIHRMREQEGGVHITNRGRSGGPPKWLNRVILAVATAIIVGAITTTATTIVVVGSLVTEFHAYIVSNDRRVDRVEKQTDENTKRLDRGGGM
jgi:hypothetical protein